MMYERFMSPGQVAPAQDRQLTWVVRGFQFANDFQDFLRRYDVTPTQMAHLDVSASHGFTVLLYVPAATARKMEGGQ